MKNAPAPACEYVLDSFALLAFFNDEPGGSAVREIFEHAQSHPSRLYLSAVNLSECLYIVERRLGPPQTEAACDSLTTGADAAGVLRLPALRADAQLVGQRAGRKPTMYCPSRSRITTSP
ncbi:MAG: PIN domain-containing protein [Acidobacteriota bacterium]|jgi:predicted nucleic acid-binding protein|nr:PIN domain-containing protein [Acidobacteriota bacterium]